MFEAGALAKTIDNKTFVCPYLIDLQGIDPQHPLSQFQWKRATSKEETYDLVRSMHSALLKSGKDVDLTESEVKDSFEQWWPHLKDQFEKIPPVADAGAKKESRPDPIEEMLALTRGMARSISDLQSSVASVTSGASGVAFGGWPSGIGQGPDLMSMVGSTVPGRPYAFPWSFRGGSRMINAITGESIEEPAPAEAEAKPAKPANRSSPTFV